MACVGWEELNTNKLAVGIDKGLEIVVDTKVVEEKSGDQVTVASMPDLSELAEDLGPNLRVEIA